MIKVQFQPAWFGPPERATNKSDEVTPAIDQEAEQRCNPNSRQRQWDDDPDKRPHDAQTVNSRRVKKLVGKIAEKAMQYPNHQRQHNR